MPSLACERFGSGTKPVLLLHGFLGSGRNLWTLARRLVAARPDYTAIVADLPGHGRSPALPEHPSLAIVGEAIATFCATLAGQIPIVGHSIGGRVALAAARAAPTRISSVLLLDIAPGPVIDLGLDLGKVLDAVLQAPATAESRDTMRGFFLRAGLSVGIAEWLVLNLDRDPGGVHWRVDREALARFQQTASAVDLWPVTEQVPVHCLRGARSPFVSDADFDRLRAAGGQCATINDAGHYLHIENAVAVVQEIGHLLA